MRESYKTAICGIVASLALVLMLLTYINPFLTYTMPPFAGILLIIILLEVGGGWAFGTYVSISLLSIFLLSDKEAAMMFIAFFGYYPILRSYLVKKIHIKPICYLLSFLLYNLSMVAAVAVCMFVFAQDYSEFEELGKYALVFVGIMMEAIFFLYDFLLERITIAYRLKWKSKLRRIIHKK